MTRMVTRRKAVVYDAPSSWEAACLSTMWRQRWLGMGSAWTVASGRMRWTAGRVRLRMVLGSVASDGLLGRQRNGCFGQGMARSRRSSLVLGACFPLCGALRLGS